MNATAERPKRGRPAIPGPADPIKFGEVRDRLDAWAAKHGMSRAEAARVLVERALDAEDARRGGRLFEAYLPRTNERLRFRSLRSLVKRVGGDDYVVEPVDPTDAEHRTIIVYRLRGESDRQRVTSAIVPAAAVEVAL